MSDFIPSAVPACYGAATAFTRDSCACKACEAFAACESESLATLERIREVIDVKDLLARHERARRKVIKETKLEAAPESRLPIRQVERKVAVEKVEPVISTEDEKIIATLPVKVAAFAITIVKNGTIARARKVKAGDQNPFEGASYGVGVAYELLRSGGFTGTSLIAAMREQLPEVKGASLPSYASMAARILTAFGIARQGMTKQGGAGWVLGDEHAPS